jgi:hypothetical protein
MSDAGEFIDRVLEWDGVDEQGPAQWIAENADAIMNEAETGQLGPIADAFDRIEQMADSGAEATAWGLAGLFGSVRNAAGAAFGKTFGYVSGGVRGVRRGAANLWNSLSALFNRYRPKLLAIARKLHATGYSLGFQVPPPASTMALNFDLPTS